jgi:hypothetical protein
VHSIPAGRVDDIFFAFETLLYENTFYCCIFPTVPYLFGLLETLYLRDSFAARAFDDFEDARLIMGLRWI